MGKTVISKLGKSVIDVLRGAEDGLTLAEISTAVGEDVKSGVVTGLVKRNFIEVIGSREIERMGHRKVATYAFVDADVHKKEDGKDFNYTDNEKELLSVAKDVEGTFTLAELAVLMNKDRLTSGSINGLVKKGNIVKCDEMRTIDVVNKAEVNVYGFLADVPADAEVK